MEQIEIEKKLLAGAESALAAWLEHAQKFYFGKFPAELFIETKSSKRSSFFA